MTIEQVIDAADSLYPNTFSAQMKTMWLNECEAAVQTDAFLLPPEAVVMHVWQGQQTVCGLSFPASDTVKSPVPLEVTAGSRITVTGLETYSENNGVTAQIASVSADRRTVKLTEGAFAATGTEPDYGISDISCDGRTARLLAPAAYAQLYREYLCARICAHQGNGAGYENNMTMYNVTAGRLVRYMGAKHTRRGAVTAAAFHAARSAGAN